MDSHFARKQRIQIFNLLIVRQVRIRKILFWTSGTLVIQALLNIQTRPALIGRICGAAVAFHTGNLVGEVRRLVVVLVMCLGDGIAIGILRVEPRRAGTDVVRSTLCLSYHVMECTVHVIARSKTAHAINKAADACFNRNIVRTRACIYMHAIVVHHDQNRCFIKLIVSRRRFFN